MAVVQSEECRGISEALCVVIPAFNEELLVERCVRSVLAAGVAPEHVYVVNDRSTDRTADVVRAIPGVRLLTNEQQLGKQGSIRRAMLDCDLTARYEFLSLLDADSHVEPDYFLEVIARFGSDESIALVCGAPHSEQHNWLTAYRALEYAITLKAFRTGQDALGVITVAPGCASTYRTRVLPYLDWNARTLVEDMDLTVQIHRKHLGRIVYTPFAGAHTQDPKTLRQYIGQLTRWYSGTWQVMKLRRVPLGRQRIDAEFGLLTAEGLAYAVLWAAAPLLFWLRPAFALQCVLLDQLVWFAIAVVFAVHLRRADILMFFPSFLLIRAVNCGVLLHTFWREVVRGRTRRDWFSVARYASPSSSTHSTAEVSNA
jgi:cellulose synthase/poly-beta-1,6-N-acetylglucosamine synthase-like glycosyltransferase